MLWELLMIIFSDNLQIYKKQKTIPVKICLEKHIC